MPEEQTEEEEGSAPDDKAEDQIVGRNGSNIAIDRFQRGIEAIHV